MIFDDKEIQNEIKVTHQENAQLKYKTALTKAGLVREIKSGLGSQIRKNPRGIKIIKKSFFVKFKEWLFKVFTKF